MTIPPGDPTAIVTMAEPRDRGGRRVRRGRASPILWVIAAAVLVPALVPFGMLVARTLANAGRAVDIAVSLRTLELVANTVLLVTTVSTAAAAVGIGAAWITERTDIPGRRIWRVVAALPLVIPSYVIALAIVSAGGDGGMGREVLGISLPALEGFTGAFLALTVSTYPFVYLPAAVALRRLDPAHEEAARGLGSTPARVFRTVVLPQLRPAQEKKNAPSAASGPAAPRKPSLRWGRSGRGSSWCPPLPSRRPCS